LLGEDEKVLGEYELVVDASGLTSPLRKYRVVEDEEDKMKWYTGETWIQGGFIDPETSIDPSLVDKLGQGTGSVMGPQGQNFTLQRYGAAVDDHRTTLMWRVTNERAREDPAFVSKQVGLPAVSKFFEDEESMAPLKQYIKNEMDALYGKEYREAIDSLDRIAVRPIFQHPANPVFVEDELPLICIGDALHTVPPYTGLGGNLAMHDTIDLSDLITSKEGITIRGLRDIEQKICRRAADVVKDADKTKEWFQGLGKRLENKDEKQIRDLTMEEFVGDQVNPLLMKVGLKLYYATLTVSSWLEPVLPSRVTTAYKI
jgi:2-polyprenyl-6-methoxyphenol hydroxylase-like FAD-dependent oxidoreductase